MENFDFNKLKKIGQIENLDDAVHEFEKIFGDLASNEYNVLPNVVYIRKKLRQNHIIHIITKKWIIAYEIPYEVWDDFEEKDLAPYCGYDLTYKDLLMRALQLI